MDLEAEIAQARVPFCLLAADTPAFTLQLDVDGATASEQDLDVGLASVHTLDLGAPPLALGEADALHADLECYAAPAQVRDDGGLYVFLKPPGVRVVPVAAREERWRWVASAEVWAGHDQILSGAIEVANLRHRTVVINTADPPTRPPCGVPIMLVCRGLDGDIFHTGPARREKKWHAFGDAYRLLTGVALHPDIDILGWWPSTQETSKENRDDEI